MLGWPSWPPDGAVGQRASRPSVASRGSRAGRASRPAATWSVIACWASSSGWGPSRVGAPRRARPRTPAGASLGIRAGCGARIASGPQPLHEGGEVAGAQGRSRSNERQLRSAMRTERHRLARGNRLRGTQRRSPRPSRAARAPARALRCPRPDGRAPTSRRGRGRRGSGTGAQGVFDEREPEAAIWRHTYLMGFRGIGVTADQAASVPTAPGLVWYVRSSIGT